MALTPQEIHSKDFTSRGRGFDKVEVNDFLDQVVIDFENLINENQTLKTKVADAEANAQQVEEMKQSVNSSILIAQEAAERLKKQTESEVEATRSQAESQAQKTVLDATSKANGIITKANNDADQIKNDSQAEIDRLKAEKDALNQEMTAFKSKLTGILKNQIDLVNNDADWADISNSTVSSSASDEMVSSEAATSVAVASSSAAPKASSMASSSADLDFEAAVQAKLAEFSGDNKKNAAKTDEVDTVVVLPEKDENKGQFLNKD
ncbi:DivIVA domain-containing protein [Weissella coleopterorum]|uniref:DivIVA domain-containing protein n=1 Tax=Weissella coleopterorum TaxID=2714949 RepID=A0A6G8AZW5_9LACO|nr:DivIVA domain-containing protein [Weissella coleopterorum]QIL50546.1 DivIVA domain-containing protein [Weissella coleopterorum]